MCIYYSECGTETSSHSFWVCEKSDGVRVLLFIYTDLETNDQVVFLVRTW